MNRKQRRRAGRETRRRGGAAPGAATPASADPRIARVQAFGASGRYADAIDLCDAILSDSPDDPDALHLRGLALAQCGRPEEGLEGLRRAVTLQPRNPLYLNHLGVVLSGIGNLEAALEAYQAAVAIAPDIADIRNNLGHALAKLDRTAEAVEAYKRTIADAPRHIAALHGLGSGLQALGRIDEALDVFRRALAADPRRADSHYNIATLLQAAGRFDESEAAYNKAIALKPDYADALNNLGTLHEARGRWTEAVDTYGRAVDARPDYAEAWFNLGNVHDKREDFAAAIDPLCRAVALLPTGIKSLGSLITVKKRICDWDGLEALIDSYRDAIATAAAEGTLRDPQPFGALSLPMSEAEHQTIARAVARVRTKSATALQRGPAFDHARTMRGGAEEPLTIGYMSADFREHPVAHLIAGLFARHDRSRVRVHGYSLGVDDGSDYRRRIAADVDRFVDLRGISDWEAASAIHADGVDILVDLTGYTTHARTEIVALRPAPVRVNYLGYPGTMGADFVDYIIVDHTVVPETEAEFYDEALVTMPHCYQVTDDEQAIADAIPTRADCGLPETGFVFCSFNNTYKIDADSFGTWMDVLREVPDSVLWLFRSNPLCEANLRREAESRGVDSGRLVFAARKPKDRHLARHRLADLFLDTFTYNAHTTASDALWAGLPLLTVEGTTFAGRVAASLLRTVGTPEMICVDRQEFRTRAVALASDPSALGTVRERLAANRRTCPLFDTGRFARGLEAAYAEMWRRHCAGEPPRAMDVIDG